MESDFDTFQLELDEPITQLSFDHPRVFVAACSRSGSIRVWEKKEDAHRYTYSGDFEVPGPPTKLCWAHPVYSPMLAVATSAGAVYVWQQICSLALEDDEVASDPAWALVAELCDTHKPVRDVQFAPRQHGLLLAACGDDGAVRVYDSALDLQRPAWQLNSVFKVGCPCRCVTWRHHTAGVPPLLLVGGSEGASAWYYHAKAMSWKLSARLPLRRGEGGSPSSAAADADKEEVVALDLAATLGRPQELLALATAGGAVAVLALTGRAEALTAQCLVRLVHREEVWKVSWNAMGTCLAAGTSGARLVFWKALMDGTWTAVSSIGSASPTNGGLHAAFAMLE